jgi:serine/threonine protein kinase
MAQSSLEQSLLEQGDGRLDDYTVEKAIGRGHFSVVHRAVRKSDGRKVIKTKLNCWKRSPAIATGHTYYAQHRPALPAILSPSSHAVRQVALKKVQIFDMMDAKTRERCLKEVQLLQTLEPHPCIIQYLDSFITDNELYIVFEFAEHGDLRRLLRRALECNATLQEPQIWRYFTQVRKLWAESQMARLSSGDHPINNPNSSAGGAVVGERWCRSYRSGATLRRYGSHGHGVGGQQP